MAGVAALGAAMAGVLAAPAFIDWDARRNQVARLAAERLGRPVALSGPLHVTLLPRPVLEASGVLIGEGGDGLGIATESLHLRLDGPSLLLGRLVVREAALVGAEIRLPWPPQSLAGLVPPPWLTALDARVERGRILVGGVTLEGVQARLLAGGPAEALSAEGTLRWDGRPLGFAATLGRAGEDGAAPLDLSVAAEGGMVAARGILPGPGGFEGRLEASGSDLAAFLPAPPGAFRAAARLSASAEVLAASGLTLELGGQALSGAAALRLAAAPRLEASLAAPRLDLAPWLAALRGAGAARLPVALDLAAEGATLGPLRLRRLRGTAHLEGERLTLSDIAAELPGEGRLEATGASAGPRLDLALRVAAGEPRALLEALGWPAALPLPPGALDAQMRLSAEGAALSATDLAARWGESRLAGGFTWRRNGARPMLALGLEADALPLPTTAPALLAALRGPGADLQLRLAAGSLLLADGTWDALSLDGAAEGDRWVIRRLAARHLGLEWTLAGGLAGGRLADTTLEAQGPAGPLLARLGWSRPALAQAPLRLRAAAAGPLDALALRGELELAEARLEGQGTLDWPAGRGQGALTARHPGAVRLLGGAFGGAAPDFLGEGSFSLVANWQLRPDAWASDGFDLVAGALRARGQGSVSRGGARRAVAGRLHFEHLPLPEWGALLPEAWPDLDLALRADTVAAPGLPALSAASAALRADAAALRLEEGRAAVLGGEASLRLRRAGAALEAEGALADAVLAGPAFGTPLDVTAGRLGAEWRLAARGHAPAALRETLSGTARLSLRDAVAQGFDATAAAAALGWEDTRRAEAALRSALAGGATPLERAEIRLSLADGVATVEEGALLAEGGLALALSGRLDLPREVLALRLAFPSAPEVALRADGPAASPVRLPELGAWLRARAGLAP
ncbi:AsmA-like C-terminal region-containing protein [Roseococcus sp. DSY-14]|uniref:AsmA-like C-terminal region-containing protein n=1 Tax=Roseococcus sp. DSY-14 TaxID=3369650 RepID=UPI00387AB5C0